MREIKFRAWNKDGEEWLYAGKKNGNISFPFTVSNPTELELCGNSSYENEVWKLPDIEELVWCQYTGLKDKNGVEIYEGDIVKVVLDEFFEVKFIQGAFVLYSPVRSTKFNIDMFLNKRMEVIGNIYENHELLKD